MAGQQIAAVDVVGDHVVRREVVFVKVQQYIRKPEGGRFTDVIQAELAHEDEAVHPAGLRQGGKLAGFFRFGGDDLQHGYQAETLAAGHDIPVHGVIKGVFVEEAVGDQDPDALSGGKQGGRLPGLPVAQLPRGGDDAFPEGVADAFLPGKALGNGDDADPELFGDIRHTNRTCHLSSPLLLLMILIKNLLK